MRYDRQADPSAKLFYNDYYNYHPVRRQAIYDMLAGLLADGVPVDGVGLQCHLNLEPGTDPSEQSYHQTVANLEEAITMYSSCLWRDQLQWPSGRVDYARGQ
jgi:endo-1,4-beta-xylanase